MKIGTKALELRVIVIPIDFVRTSLAAYIYSSNNCGIVAILG